MDNRSSSKNLNYRIARRLEEVAQLLAAQGGNPFRAQAYRRAAETLRGLPRPADEILRQEGESRHLAWLILGSETIFVVKKTKP